MGGGVESRGEDELVLVFRKCTLLSVLVLHKCIPFVFIYSIRYGLCILTSLSLRAYYGFCQNLKYCLTIKFKDWLARPDRDQRIYAFEY